VGGQAESSAGVRVASFETDCGRSARPPNPIEFVLSALAEVWVSGRGAHRTTRSSMATSVLRSWLPVGRAHSHTPIAWPHALATTPTISLQCSRRDLNPHGLPRRNLNPVGAYRAAARCSETRISPGILATSRVVSIQPVDDSKTIQTERHHATSHRNWRTQPPGSASRGLAPVELAPKLDSYASLRARSETYTVAPFAWDADRAPSSARHEEGRQARHQQAAVSGDPAGSIAIRPRRAT